MPDLTDESTAIAQALVNDAHRVLRVVGNRDLRTTHSTYAQLDLSIRFADHRLDALRRGLLRDLERELYPERFTFPPMPPNPYRLPPGSTGDSDRLSDEELLEETRYYYWWYTHEPNPLTRWNVSKRFSELRRQVVARGYAHDAWTDGTEAEQP